LATSTRVDAKSVQTDEEARICEELRVEETDTRCRRIIDSETNPEFIRFLRYAKRSCTEVQSELYVALDEEYISPGEFKDA